jgi:hypothetical protein
VIRKLATVAAVAILAAGCHGQRHGPEPAPPYTDRQVAIDLFAVIVSAVIGVVIAKLGR